MGFLKYNISDVFPLTPRSASNVPKSSSESYNMRNPMLICESAWGKHSTSHPNNVGDVEATPATHNGNTLRC